MITIEAKITKGCKREEFIEEAYDLIKTSFEYGLIKIEDIKALSELTLELYNRKKEEGFGE